MVQQIYIWAKEKGYKHTVAQQQNELSPFGYNLAKFLVLNRIKTELGLERAERLYFGAAPLNSKIRQFFMSLNMPLINMYGLSETAGPTSYLEPPYLFSFDKVGKAFPGTHIKIFNPDEMGVGEICIKGRNVFIGYLKSPESTFEVMDSEGYFHSGDIGVFDKNGMLEITGRLKEIIITAGGENISPIHAENLLIETCPILSHAVIIGDERKYLSCLLTLITRYDHQVGRPTAELGSEVINFISSTLNSSARTI